MRSSLLISLATAITTTTTLVAATPEPDFSPLYRLALSKRASPACNKSDGEKACGDFCIPSSFTCCPDKTGGCPSNKRCFLGSNLAYGCCLKGKICSGAGGEVSTSTRKPSTSTTKSSAATKTGSTITSTITPAPETDTAVDDDPETGTETASLEPLTSTFVVYADGTSSSGSAAASGIATPIAYGPPTFTTGRGGALATTAGGANPFGDSGTSSAAPLLTFSPVAALSALFGLLLAM